MAISNYDQELYPFESKWVSINDNKIHFIDEGEGEVILFCHPPIASSFMYRNMIKPLSKSFRCIALDFPGFGLSEASATYKQTIESQADIVEGLLKRLNLGGVYLVMQEVGGHAAFSVFLKHPELLKGLILTDTIPFPVSQYPKIGRMLNIVNGSVFNFFNSRFNLLIRVLTSSGIKKRTMSVAEKDTYKAMFSTSQIRRTSTVLLHQLAESEQLLAQIQRALETTFNSLPILIVYGEDDSLTKLGVPQRVYKLVSNAELHWITGEEHFPHEGAPEEMSDLISGWIKKQANSD